MAELFLSIDWAGQSDMPGYNDAETLDSIIGGMRLVAVLRETALILIVAVALAGVGFMIRPTERPAAPDGTGTDGGVDQSSPVAVIRLEDARRHFEMGTALFADARPRDAYRLGHIPGAMNLDPNEFDAWSGDFFSKTPPDQIIITYCEGERCTLSLELAEKLAWMGYEKVFHLKNGWGQWKAHRLTVERNAE